MYKYTYFWPITLYRPVKSQIDPLMSTGNTHNTDTLTQIQNKQTSAQTNVKLTKCYDNFQLTQLNNNILEIIVQHTTCPIQWRRKLETFEGMGSKN